MERFTINKIVSGRSLSRRDFLKLTASFLGSLALYACTPKSTTEVPFLTPTPDNRMDNLSPDPSRFSTRKSLAGIESMGSLTENELKSLESRAVVAAKKINLDLNDPRYETNLLGIKLEDGSQGEISHVFVLRTLKANAPEPTAGPTSNQADQAGLYFLVDVDPPYFVPPGETSNGDARMFPVVGYEIDNGFALGLGTPNPDGQTYTATFGFCSIEVNNETLEATKVTYVDPYSGNYKIYEPGNVPPEIESMYTKVLPIHVAAKTEDQAEATPLNENDLNLIFDTPPYNEKIYKGGELSGKWSIDKSLDPLWRSIEVSGETQATSMLMVLHEVFEKQNPGISIEEYAQMIKDVQDGKADPKTIGITLHGNLLNDNEPFKLENGKINKGAQKPIFLIPWTNRKATTETIIKDGIEYQTVSVPEVNVAFVRSEKVKNITTISDAQMGLGVNILPDQSITFYCGVGNILLYSDYYKHPANIYTILSILPWYINNNISGTLKFSQSSQTKSIENYLKHQTITIK